METGTSYHKASTGDEIDVLVVPELTAGWVIEDEVHVAIIEDMLKAPPCYNGVANKILSMDRIDTHLGLHEGPTLTNPVPTMTHNRVSQMAKHSPAVNVLQKMVEAKMPDKCGMSILELMSLTPYAFKELHRICTMSAANESAEVDNVLTDLEKAAAKAKKNI